MDQADEPAGGKGDRPSDPEYREGSLSLLDTVAMGTGVMIGAGIFALTGQIAELAGTWFPVAFMVAAVISGLSAYSYAKVSGRWPSAGGIAMILSRAYGRSTATAAGAMMMVLSMVINESLVARTFGTYTLRLFGAEDSGPLVPALALGLIVFGFLVNLAGNEVIGTISKVSAVIKVGGIAVFAAAALVAAGFAYQPEPASGGDAGVGGVIGAFALAILAYKGFTTITNSGGEVEDPHRNVGRAIAISLAVCVVVYLLVAFAVGSSLGIDEIVEAKNYSLAEAARPAFGSFGVTLTALLAIVATASGVLASLFAVSRMLAMLTDMKLVPHSHFGMSGPIQKHTLVYTVVVAGSLAVFLDLTRIAAMGAILYLVMDVLIHWGVLRHLREEVEARAWVPAAAITADVFALTAFVWVKGGSDPTVIGLSVVVIVGIAVFEWWYLRRTPAADHSAMPTD